MNPRLVHRRRRPSGGCRMVRWTDWPPTAFWWCTRATASTRTLNLACGGKSRSAATSSRCGKPDHLSRGARWWVTPAAPHGSCSFTERKQIRANAFSSSYNICKSRFVLNILNSLLCTFIFICLLPCFCWCIAVFFARYCHQLSISRTAWTQRLK